MPPGGRLLRAELGGTGVVIMARRRLGAEHAIAPLDHVQVNLEDAPLAPQPFSSISVMMASSTLRK